MSVSFKTSPVSRAKLTYRTAERNVEMEPRIHVITLAVDELQQALTFYRDGLGLNSDGVAGTEFHDDHSGAEGAIAMFHLAGGVILAVYPRSELAKDAGVPLTPSKTGEFSLGHAVASRNDVDALLARAGAAGGKVLDTARDRPWGIYSGYFQDPDGHLWEIMHNPALDDGAT
jgi:catechol 2,3-dioxygenase-like lactoylglutathione lyase family enzyme